MEAGLGELLNWEENRPTRFSHSNHLQKESRSTKLFAAVDDQKAHSCNHFTIRGYVDSMRKKDARLCWPFIMLDNIIPEEALPPMHVIHFKRWNCRDCLQRTNASINVDQNGDDDVERKSRGISCHGNNALQDHFISSEQVYEDHIHRISPETDNGISKSPPLDLTKRGSELPQRCDANPDHDKTNSSKSHLFKKRETSFLEEREEGNTGKDFPSTSAPFEVVMPKSNKLDNEFPGRIDALPGSKKNNGTTCGYEGKEGAFELSQEKQRVGVLEELSEPLKITPNIHLKTDSAADNHDQGFMHLKKITKTIPTGGPVPYGSESESGENSEELSFMDSRLHHKKVRKVRLLSDIIRSGELRRSGVVQISHGDTKDRNFAKELPGKAHLVDHKCLFSDRKEKLILNKRDRDNESSENEDEGPSLMHWLKNVSRRRISSEEAKAKLIRNCKRIASKSAPSASLEKVAAVNDKGISIREMDKVNSTRCKPLPLSKQNSTPTKVTTTSKDIVLKQLHPRKRKQDRSVEIPRLGLITKHNLKKASLDKKNKVSLIEEQGRMCSLKGSSNKKACSSMDNFPDDKIARKKEKDRPTSKQDTLDDFPMDIVELLARNQHERHQMNAEAAVQYVDRVSENNNHGNVSQIGGSMNTDNPGAFSEFIGHRRLFQLNNERRIRSSTCRFSNNELDNHHIDLNRESVPCHPHIGFSNFQLNGPRNYFCDSNNKREDCQAFKVNHYMRTSCQSTCKDYDELHCSHVPNTSERNYGFNYGSEATGRACNKNNMLSETDSRQPSDSSRVKILDKMDGSSNFHDNEEISAMHLLGLMDLRSCSDQLLHSSISTNHVFNGHDQLDQLPRHSAGVKINEPETQKQHYLASGNSNQDHHPENFHKPLRPLPRFGVLGSLLQKERKSHLKNSEAPFGFKGRYVNNLINPELGSRNEAEESPTAYVSRHPHSTPVNHVIDRVRCRDNGRLLQQVNSSCKMEVCSVNRNPADFVIPDEDCEFMIKGDDLRCSPKGLTGPGSCHKPKKLSKIKEFLRS